MSSDGATPEVRPLRLAVVGANGRMGRAVVRLAHEAGIAVVAAFGTGAVGRDAGELAGISALGVPVTDTLATVVSSRADVVIDFSAPAALVELASACARANIALVSGTTGLDEASRAALDTAAKACAVMWEPNMSVGVHVLSMLIEKARGWLGPTFDVEVVETHHRAKVDAPSGTALRLAEVARGSGEVFVHGREGRPGPRRANEIGLHAVRGGDVIGDHTVYFFGDGERLELTHRASNRDLFAHGALRAAQFVAGRPPGRYSLAQMIGAQMTDAH